MNIIRNIFNTLTSTRAAGAYLLLFAIAIGVGTFIENDFGTSSAQVLVYRSLWFEILLFLFSASILANIQRYRLIQLKKWGSLTFHLAIIVILIGAGITRYFGTEGMMQLIADEYENSSIRTNCINPGATRTKMRNAAYPGEDQRQLKTPADIMPLYLYLMSDQSCDINGQTLDVQTK